MYGDLITEWPPTKLLCEKLTSEHPNERPSAREGLEMFENIIVDNISWQACLFAERWPSMRTYKRMTQPSKRHGPMHMRMKAMGYMVRRASNILRMQILFMSGKR